MEIVLGIDLGTSYFKAALFDRHGSCLGLGRVAVEKDTANGKCEVPVERFWALLRKALSDALAAACADASDIKAISYSSQANSFVLLDSSGKALTPLILWPDVRSTEIAPELRDLNARPDFLQRTGLGIDFAPGFCVAKLKYIEANQPQLWSKVARVLTIADYFSYSLTGLSNGDASTAELLGLYDVASHAWWTDAFKTLGLDQKLFVKPLLPGTVIGKTIPAAHDLLGIPAGLTFSAGGLDHYIAAIGAGVGTIASISESTGTVLACVRQGNTYQPRRTCCTGPGTSPEIFYDLAFGENGASVLEWYQKTHAPQIPIAKLVELAASVPADCDGLVALECANTFPGLSGFKGLKPSHSNGHFARAILISVAKSLKTLVEQFGAIEGGSKVVATGGGAKSDLWLQIKADLLGAEFIVTNCDEPACRGAAMLAALGLKWFGSTGELGAEWIKVCKTFRPSRASN